MKVSGKLLFGLQDYGLHLFLEIIADEVIKNQIGIMITQIEYYLPQQNRVKKNKKEEELNSGFTTHSIW
jgi:hypothetical protein